ncbi:MAG: hypothetical protein M0Z53_10540 [Thermaerobacter sp.]|nr:hypothetical protein [Thermaerobacter sp.]
MAGLSFVAVVNPYSVAGLAFVIFLLTFVPGSRPTPPTPQWIDGSRRILWRGLGGLWLLDGLLQLQPKLFAPRWAPGVFFSAAMGQPQGLANIVTATGVFWGQHVVVVNLAVVILQIGIGLSLLLWPEQRIGRIGLVLSLLWGLAVWMIAEGLGGILSGTANLFDGGPGAAILYVIAGAMLLIPDKLWRNGLASGVLRKTIGLVFFVSALYQSASPLWMGAGQRMLYSQAATPQPSWLSDPIRTVGEFAASHAMMLNGSLVAAMFVTGFVWWWQWRSPWFDGLTVAWLLGIWWMGQDFGMLGGTGTDPNSIPVLVLLMAAARNYQTNFAMSPKMGRRWRRISHSAP